MTTDKSSVSSVIRNWDFLQFFVMARPKQQKQLLAISTDDQLRALSEIAHNALVKNVPLESVQKSGVKGRYRTKMFKLADKHVPVRYKREMLTQQSGGFLPFLIPIVSAALGTLAGRLVNRALDKAKL